MLKVLRFDEARLVWQAWVHAFGDHSFYSTLVAIFSSTSAPGSKLWKKPDDFELFGVLGIGSGGLSGMYHVGFTEILQLAINDYEDDQCLIIGGKSILAERLGNQMIQNDKLSEHICFDAAWSRPKNRLSLSSSSCIRPLKLSTYPFLHQFSLRDVVPLDLVIFRPSKDGIRREFGYRRLSACERNTLPRDTTGRYD
ncbi:tryptophan 2-monooxygenase-like [Quillaja saponaria]|uniref:Tryptophan 2-monooxygenase-like n=1 Tax=Quillaja saponaria TaxID=32244 RepID=A0AAD7QD18_QUISA|nr:tryptophan 2-monooxygenase-like [Quillaja saponaria]